MWHRGFEPSCRAAPATATLNRFRDFCERAPGGPAHPPMRLFQALLGLHTGRVQTYRLRGFLASRGAGRRILTIRTDSVRKVTCKFLRHSGTVRLDALKTQNLKVSGILTNATVLRRISYRTSESPAGSDFKPSRYAIHISVSSKWRHRGTPRRMNERAP